MCVVVAAVRWFPTEPDLRTVDGERKLLAGGHDGPPRHVVGGRHHEHA